MMVVCLSMMLGGCAIPKQYYRSNTIIWPRVTIEDDSMSKTAKFSTLSNKKYKAGGNVQTYSGIRAWVNKKHAVSSYQLYITLTYTGSSWRFYTRANVKTSNGLKSAKVVSINRDVSCSVFGYSSRCTYYETIGIDINNEDLDFYEANGLKYKIMSNGIDINNEANGLKYKIMFKGGVDYIGTIPASEMSMISKAVKDYLKRNHS